MVVVLCSGAGYLLMSRLTYLWEFYIYFGLLVGVGSSLMASLLSLIPRWFTNHRTMMAGIISAGGGVGGLVMPLVANWLITTFNWHRAYLFMGIALLIVTVIAVQFLKRSPAYVTDGQPIDTAAKEKNDRQN